MCLEMGPRSVVSGKLLLIFASAVILGSESRGSRGHILLPRDSGKSYNSRKWGLLFDEKIFSQHVSYCGSNTQYPEILRNVFGTLANVEVSQGC
jgi:hypothetical protein